MRRSRKRSQPAATGQGPQLSGALKIASQEEDGVEAAMVSSGGSPASGIAPPSDPLTEEAIFERTSESGWYTVDNDGFNRPVAYRRTPRFDDRTDRTAKPKMLFRSVEELPEWVQASNRLWLVRCPPPAIPSARCLCTYRGPELLTAVPDVCAAAALFRFRSRTTGCRVAWWTARSAGRKRDSAKFSRWHSPRRSRGVAGRIR